MVVRGRQAAGGDEGRVLCVLVTCRTAEGVENTLLSRYFDGCDAAAQVCMCVCLYVVYRCGGRADTGRMQAEVEAEVWESTRHDVAQISDDGEQMVSLVAGRWRVCPVHWPRELDELNVF